MSATRTSSSYCGLLQGKIGHFNHLRESARRPRLRMCPRCASEHSGRGQYCRVCQDLADRLGIQLSQTKGKPLSYRDMVKNRNRFDRYTSAVLLLLALLTFAGCRDDDPPPPPAPHSEARVYYIKTRESVEITETWPTYIGFQASFRADPLPGYTRQWTVSGGATLYSEPDFILVSVDQPLVVVRCDYIPTVPQ